MAIYKLIIKTKKDVRIGSYLFGSKQGAKNAAERAKAKGYHYRIRPVRY